LFEKSFFVVCFFEYSNSKQLSFIKTFFTLIQYPSRQISS